MDFLASLPNAFCICAPEDSRASSHACGPSVVLPGHRFASSGWWWRGGSRSQLATRTLPSEAPSSKAAAGLVAASLKPTGGCCKRARQRWRLHATALTLQRTNRRQGPRRQGPRRQGPPPPAPTFNSTRWWCVTRTPRHHRRTPRHHRRTPRHCYRTPRQHRRTPRHHRPQRRQCYHRRHRSLHLYLPEAQCAPRCIATLMNHLLPTDCISHKYT